MIEFRNTIRHRCDLHAEANSSKILSFDRGFTFAGSVQAMNDSGSKILALQEENEFQAPGKNCLTFLNNIFGKTFYLGPKTSVVM